MDPAWTLYGPYMDPIWTLSLPLDDDIIFATDVDVYTPQDVHQG